MCYFSLDEVCKLKDTKVSTVADKVVDNTRQVKKDATTKVINGDHSKIFDNDGKLIPIVETTASLKNGHGAIKMTDTKTPKTTAKKVATTAKKSKPWKYNAPMGELVTLLEKYKKENNPLATDLEAVIEKRRANWKQYYAKNPEKYKQWSKNWRDNNPGKVKASQQKYQAKKKASEKSTTPKPKATKTATKPKTVKKSKKSSSNKSK